MFISHNLSFTIQTEHKTNASTLGSGPDAIQEKNNEEQKVDKQKGWRKQVSFEEMISSKI